VLGRVDEWIEERKEIWCTIEKQSKSLESFRATTNYRLGLYQSKEAKLVADYFSR
jgi:hypothetical protein